MVKAILRGHEQSTLGSKVPRLPVTIPVMRLIRKLLVMNKMEFSKKRLIWAICCIAFHGSFRIHELLSKDGLSFDPTTTLLRRTCGSLRSRLREQWKMC